MMVVAVSDSVERGRKFETACRVWEGFGTRSVQRVPLVEYTIIK